MTIREARAALGWSRCELANRTGYSETTVRKWEAGELWPPDWLEWWLADLAAYVAARPAPRFPG